MPDPQGSVLRLQARLRDEVCVQDSLRAASGELQEDDLRSAGCLPQGSGDGLLPLPAGMSEALLCPGSEGLCGTDEDLRRVDGLVAGEPLRVTAFCEGRSNLIGPCFFFVVRMFFHHRGSEDVGVNRLLDVRSRNAAS